MPHPPADVVPAGHPARRAAAFAIGFSLLTSVLFTVFGYLTTQDKAVQAVSPWHDDPYVGAVSFTEFLVPALAALIVLRLILWRRGAALPRYRLDQLLRAAAVELALIAGTVATDWVAVALRADRPLWNSTTAWLIAALGVLTLACAGCGWSWRRAWRLVPKGRLDGDWLDDLAQLADQVLAMVRDRPADLRGPIAVLREHIGVFAFGLSLLAAIGVTSGQVIGEGWSDPVLTGALLVILTGGFLAFCLISDIALHIALPRHAPSRWRAAMLAGCVGLPVSSVFRSEIWAGLGQSGDVRTPAEFALVSAVGAVFAGVLALLVSVLTARAARRAG